jgi:Lon protease-like protein
VVPLFPLADVWLFPFFVLPLHVFEPRYRQLIEDILDGIGRLVLGTIQAGHEHEAEGSPPIYPIAGLGEIGRHERLPDGRFRILLVGLQRVFVKEVSSARLYRQVEAHPAPELPLEKREETELRAPLLAALRERMETLPEGIEKSTTSHVVDMLLLRIPLPHELMNELYQELHVARRAREALAQHALRPKL